MEKVRRPIVREYLDSIEELDDILAIVLKTHLYTEYWIDQLVKEVSLTANESIKYSFAVKLNLIYNMGCIPEALYLNIKKLNKLRNQFAHNLDFDINDADWNYVVRQEGLALSDFETVKEKLLIVGLETFAWLNNEAVGVLMKKEYLENVEKES